MCFPRLRRGRGNTDDTCADDTDDDADAMHDDDDDDDDDEDDRGSRSQRKWQRPIDNQIIP